MVNQNESQAALRGKGGPGRGQGMKPLFNEPMLSVPIKLPAVLREFLDAGPETSSPRLRALLEWGDDHPQQVLDDPGPPPKDDITRTSYSLSKRHLEIANRLGDGKRTVGVRRIIHTALSLGLDPDQLS